MYTLQTLTRDQLDLYRNAVLKAFGEYPFTATCVSQMTNVTSAELHSRDLANRIAGYSSDNREQRINASKLRGALDTMDRLAQTIKYSQVAS